MRIGSNYNELRNKQLQEIWNDYYVSPMKRVFNLERQEYIKVYPDAKTQLHRPDVPVQVVHQFQVVADKFANQLVSFTALIERGNIISSHPNSAFDISMQKWSDLFDAYTSFKQSINYFIKFETYKSRDIVVIIDRLVVIYLSFIEALNDFQRTYARSGRGEVELDEIIMNRVDEMTNFMQTIQNKFQIFLSNAPPPPIQLNMVNQNQANSDDEEDEDDNSFYDAGSGDDDDDNDDDDDGNDDRNAGQRRAIQSLSTQSAVLNQNVGLTQQPTVYDALRTDYINTRGISAEIFNETLNAVQPFFQNPPNQPAEIGLLEHLLDFAARIHGVDRDEIVNTADTNGLSPETIQVGINHPNVTNEELINYYRRNIIFQKLEQIIEQENQRKQAYAQQQAQIQAQAQLQAAQAAQQAAQQQPPAILSAAMGDGRATVAAPAAASNDPSTKSPKIKNRGVILPISSKESVEKIKEVAKRRGLTDEEINNAESESIVNGNLDKKLLTAKLFEIQKAKIAEEEKLQNDNDVANPAQLLTLQQSTPIVSKALFTRNDDDDGYNEENSQLYTTGILPESVEKLKAGIATPHTKLTKFEELIKGKNLGTADELLDLWNSNNYEALYNLLIENEPSLRKAVISELETISPQHKDGFNKFVRQQRTPAKAAASSPIKQQSGQKRKQLQRTPVKHEEEQKEQKITTRAQTEAAKKEPKYASEFSGPGYLKFDPSEAQSAPQIALYNYAANQLKLNTNWKNSRGSSKPGIVQYKRDYVDKNGLESWDQLVSAILQIHPGYLSGSKISI